MTHTTQNHTASATADVMDRYLSEISTILTSIREEEAAAIDAAAETIAGHIAEDRLVYIYGPGGHSNLAAQEVFFRAGGLAHVSAILDDGTLLSSGAMRSMAMERTPGYGTVVLADNDIGAGDLIVLVNAYGINAALIDAALYARRVGAVVVGRGLLTAGILCAG
jgi:uncharacterized phosphosugar-binding protein